MSEEKRPSLTCEDVHQIALEIQSVRNELIAIGREDLARSLFETECRLGRSLPPVNVNITLRVK